MVLERDMYYYCEAKPTCAFFSIFFMSVTEVLILVEANPNRRWGHNIGISYTLQAIELGSSEFVLWWCIAADSTAI